MEGFRRERKRQSERKRERERDLLLLSSRRCNPEEVAFDCSLPSPSKRWIVMQSSEKVREAISKVAKMERERERDRKRERKTGKKVGGEREQHLFS